MTNSIYATMSEKLTIAERGSGSYRMQAILRWVMVLIFVAFGLQKFTPQSAYGIVQYISNSPIVGWPSVFGVRGEADLLGVIELSTAALLAAGALIAAGRLPHRGAAPAPRGVEVGDPSGPGCRPARSSVRVCSAPEATASLSKAER
jgi:hypothetical protein